jgi:beta-lactamase regulating signal transducer with metallopeptidase domain
MMAQWMVYAIGIGVMVLAAAHALDFCAARLRRPRRPVWIGAMLLMCALPAVMPRSVTRMDRLAQWLSARERSITAAEIGTGAALQTVARVDGAQVRRSPIAATSINTAFIVLAACSSLLALALVGTAALRLRRSRSAWTPAPPALQRELERETGDTTPLWVGRVSSPAALGLRRMHVVIPDWALQLTGPERSLLLAHEAAHVRAHDPRVLAAALLPIVLAPWHLPLVYAYRRLCRAIEHDCDARVVGQPHDRRAYALLLVDTAQRLAGMGAMQSRWLPATLPTFIRSTSELEARVRALSQPALTPSLRARVAGAACAAAMTLLATIAIPAPHREALAHVTPVSERLQTYPACRLDVIPRNPKAGANGERYLHDCLHDAIAERAPELTRADGPRVRTAWVILDADGRTLGFGKGEAGTRPYAEYSENALQPSASLSSSAGEFMVTRQAVRERFPALADRIDGIGVTSAIFGSVKVNVIYSIASPAKR